MKKFLNSQFIVVTLLSMFAFSANIQAKDISAYLVGDYIDVNEASKKLESAGFEIVASYTPIKKATTIVFTNKILKAQAVQSGRAHMAILRLFIDKKEHMISFTNPLYFGKAFMQDAYNEKVFKELYSSITKAFKGLKPSRDALADDDIASYHFMIGMPYYEDYDTLGEDTNAHLLAKAKEYKKGKQFLFELKLSDNSTLIGYDLGKRTKKFVKKIGRANGAVLPYCISIENGKATSLEAKYYLALSYPLLTMTEFTTIATVPGAIKKDLSKPFK